MPERHLVALQVPHVKTGALPARRDGRVPAPPFGSRRPGRSVPTPAPRNPPKNRNLPRRSGY
ncbi:MULTISPECIES: hypothetical protein [unclassified Streptomyces]|uniref:hypothetical protein n=1 Tax=unclassified Streptomyces TaxID=2593676 RepID=UPI0033296341